MVGFTQIALEASVIAGVEGADVSFHHGQGSGGSLGHGVLLTEGPSRQRAVAERSLERVNEINYDVDELEKKVHRVRFPLQTG